MCVAVLTLVSLAVASAQAFEAASVREHTGRVAAIGVMPSGNRVSVQTMQLTDLVSYAYGVKDYKVSGGAGWMEAMRWDITAKADGDAVPTREQFQKMTQALLADRFHLQVHHKTAVMETAKETMDQLATHLSNTVDRPVLNRTGLTGTYEYRLEWAPRDDSADAPSIFTALQEQFGLELDPQKAPVEILVIDHAQKRSEN